ncbi:TIGR01906 family membrane protein [Aceticella autotrophica]|uniref:TIGR01906 family membrane protein n=1 Tax=Aceticella autotrophica TaxID=2755338 RepID=A0A975GA52_9THEO|nr:TIGR01906 family membrane protein [Aceticella autotrophica]QSZ26802.1 TIGR01906 family membrane protein [Aceticella autotrophica]
MRSLNNIIAISITILLSICIILTNLQFVAFNNDFYQREFEKYKVENTTGMDINQLKKTAVRIQDYLSYKVDNLQTDTVIYEKKTKLFNDRELKHMEDVRILFKKGFFLRNISVAAIFLLILLMYFINKRLLYNLFNSLFTGMLWMLCIVVVGVIIISLNFNMWFTYFHLYFFNNNLWQFDVARDKLIQMLPEGFFSDAVYLAAKNSIITFGFILAILYFVKRKLLKPD